LMPNYGIEIRAAGPDELAGPLKLLEESLRDGEPLPSAFVGRLRRAVEGGDLDVLVAFSGGRIVGVALLAFRPSVSAGTLFASIEDLYVRPDARGRGTGRALLEAVEEQCRARGVSYVEVQTDDEATPFYEASGYEMEEDVRLLYRSHAF
jgi:GNAT superfamily N-acetyltransferase